VGDVFDRFTEATGIEVSVRYGDTAELAVTILEEGDRSPADVYFGQDAGAWARWSQRSVRNAVVRCPEPRGPRVPVQR
jgi:ABC-type Fe3+ transport system substrate-binding protein